MLPEILPNFDLSQTEFPGYWRAAGAAVILAPGGRIILQQRDGHAPVAPNMVACPGGGHDPGETLVDTVVRELSEELEIAINPAELVFLGAAKRLYRKMTLPGLVARFFWHDREGLVTHTTEGTLATYGSVAEALAIADLTFGTRWALEETVRRGLAA